MNLVTKIPSTTGKTAVSSNAGVIKGGAFKTALGSGKSSLLGLGAGLGGWGPILIVGSIAVAGVGIYTYMKQQRAAKEMEEGATEILDERELFPIE
jgi:hypothetical protein